MQYIIGIGANVGFTLENINKAIQAIASTENVKLLVKASLYSSKALLKENAPKDWDIVYLNTAIKIESSLKPLELLKNLKDIEKNIGRDLDAPVWSPRIIDLDILAAEDLILNTEQLTIPHKELLNRNFALAPLLELNKNWHHPKHIDIDLNIRLKELENIDILNQRLSKTMRMGIVNLSEQSFSDGFLTSDQRNSNLQQLIEDGAEIIDIGAESTKPNAKPISVSEEINKLDSFLDYLKSQLYTLKYRPLISIDTRKLEVMQGILAKHNDIIWMINDVECNNIQQKAKLLAKYGKKYVITHNLGIIGRNQYLEKEDSIEKIYNYIQEKKNILVSEGLNKDNIYFDVGFGFGKSADTAKYLLGNINVIKNKLNLKALVGHSRKPSVLDLDKNTSINELDIATKKLSQKLQLQDIEIIRIHKI
ncbi:dihydropteroate synthase [Allofrancisella guangzhouensis]|uniref:2-amino-4-hydroxy-6-hydroxymethyldihydropteridine pyrophosphokinase n=1 Tax=Allofrancisella guangzhouensis TaxID=594679 RepID=A0A0A8E4H7_9GAMM|nr:dihydropteroate synthase [Allofrancisella guangzhouensis]AJC48928.1 2-amino-4-hydroxy-6-hydroxymethyldihydropteridine pyrophosphokinase [Allofrancisella guangzhouensis]MBK2027107.1 dihydropteroate synthase [Allofrancisella guangzhouensis]MBK2044101.1 dihydropteroate synthase [Allofrancisella guangzhouensis]MBK2045655.1 dihydropteroate synthase [Allofrancisella guangzhouensis]